MWGAIVDQVYAAPAAAGGARVALAIPAVQLHLATPAPETLPRSIPAVETYVRMQEAFRTALPATVVVEAPNVNAPAAQAAIQEAEERALASGRMFEPITVEVNDKDGREHHRADGGRWRERGFPRRFATLRDDIVPATVGALPDAEAGVTGLTANWWTRRTRSSRRPRSCSRSCSCSHSSSCSSPSARS